MPTNPLAGLDLIIIEDEPLLRKQLASYLESLGADVTAVDTVQHARNALANGSFDIALLDIHLTDGRGTTLLKEKAFSSNTGVIVMTADGSVEAAVESLRLGALDFLVKPFDEAELPLVIARARRTRQAARIEQHRRDSAAAEPLFFGRALASLEQQLQTILAADRRMQELLPPVLIEGETGTGKTAFARWLHQQGPRGGQPLVEVNCSAVPETLAESELFGHERGAFTDARTAKLGLFEAASGGTLFLDELPSLSPGLQAKVLKTIEDHRIRRLGGTRELPIDTRVIAATHRDLRQLVAAGQFREDLLHRLDLYRVRIPPLRARGEDIIELAETLLARLSRRHRLPAKPISAAGRQRLLNHSWPGNVRELSHELERAVVFETGPELQFTGLTTDSAEAHAPSPDWFNPAFRFPEHGFDLQAAKRHLIDQALAQTQNNVSAAARMLGVTRDYLRYHLGTQKGPDDDQPSGEA